MFIYIRISIILLALLNACTPSKLDHVDELSLPYSSDNPGAAIMIIHKGDIILNRPYGLADILNNIVVGIFLPEKCFKITHFF